MLAHAAHATAARGLRGLRRPMAGMLGLRLRCWRVVGVSMRSWRRRALGWLRLNCFWRLLLASRLILLRVRLIGLVWFVGFMRGRPPMLLALTVGASVRACRRSAAPAAWSRAAPVASVRAAPVF